MFIKNSRYWMLPDIFVDDAKGRTLESKSLRFPQKVSGNITHTVEEVDRLDHLAYKYYKQPRKWWRICDANPDYLAPLALMGKDALKTVRFFLSYSGDGDKPSWHDLIDRLLILIGIEEVIFSEEAELSTENVFRVDQQSLLNLEADGVPEDVLVALEAVKNISYIGRHEFVSALESIIGSDILEASISLILSHSSVTLDGEIVVGHTESLKHTVTITYNHMNTDLEKLTDTIIESGFIIDHSEMIGQIGKRIIIPPNITV